MKTCPNKSLKIFLLLIVAGSVQAQSNQPIDNQSKPPITAADVAGIRVGDASTVLSQTVLGGVGLKRHKTHLGAAANEKLKKDAQELQSGLKNTPPVVAHHPKNCIKLSEELCLGRKLYLSKPL